MASFNDRTRLELTWIGKEYQSKREPSVYFKDSCLSYHARLSAMECLR